MPVLGESAPCPGVDMKLVSLGLSVQNIVVNGVTTLTVPKEALMAVMTVETQPVRYTVDGTTPTNTVGVLIALGTTKNICGDSLANLKLIKSSANDAPVSVAYYGVRGNP